MPAAARTLAMALVGATMLLPLADANAGTFTNLYEFNPNINAGPLGRLTASGGKLIGTTLSGGTHQAGTVFSFAPGSSAAHVYYSFTAGGTDAVNPTSGVNGTSLLVGTTPFGGAKGFGAVYTVSTITGIETVLYSFAGGASGWLPSDPPVLVTGAGYGKSGTLYGVTTYGGDFGYGTVYAIDVATAIGGKSSGWTKLHSFAGPEGAYPESVPLFYNGFLYGVADRGGVTGNGTVYRIDTYTGAGGLFYAFGAAPDGNYPSGSLLLYNGSLYGTTNEGGTMGYGTVFALNPQSGAETILHSFAAGTDGAYPQTGVVEQNGRLYGTTIGGGKDGLGELGTIFTIDLVKPAEQTLYRFPTANGAVPQELLSMKGTLYGTTYAGGTYGAGTLFSFKP
jgi:uncharacterized repeat protein (TIGR03803 family)